MFLKHDQSILVCLANVYAALEFYFYRIDGRDIGAKVLKGHLPCCFAKRIGDSSNACSWKSSANSSDTTFIMHMKI
jgi:hypothetical protein